jgi:hypothetical protein
MFLSLLKFPPNMSTTPQTYHTLTCCLCSLFLCVLLLLFFYRVVSHKVLEYIAAVRHTLREGGLWINHGPLQWHHDGAVMIALDEVQCFLVVIGE